MLRTFPLVAGLALATTLSAQTTLVAPSASFPTIQSAIAAAVNGDVVEVPDGTYSESLDLMGKAITLRSRNGALVTELRGPQRKIRAASGETRSGTIVQGFRFGGLLSGNWSSVEVLGSGLTIRDCRFMSITMGVPALSNGMKAPGLTSIGGDVLLENCRFESCAAANAPDSTGAPFPMPGADGGAILATGGALELVDCLLKSNRAGRGGSNLASSFLFTTGTRGGNGGAIAASGAAVKLRRCQVESNRAGDGGADQVPFPQLAEGAPGAGGAIWIAGSAASPASLEIVDGWFIGNQAGHQVSAPAVLTGSGGALRIEGADLVIESCFFHQNAAHRGGAISHFEAAGAPAAGSLDVVNSIFSANTASGLGGAIHAREVADGDLMHCVFHGNGAGDGAALRLDGGAVAGTRVSNSIFAGSYGPDFGSQEGTTTLAVDFGFNCSEQPLPSGLGNIVADPRLVSPAGLDFHLMADSPCIDAAAAMTESPAEDWDDETRPRGQAPDIGADEFVGVSGCAAGTVPDGQGGTADVITIDGSAGGATRYVKRPLGATPFWLIDSAPGSAMPAHFIVWGRLGIPDPAETYRIWFLGADLCFTPHLMDLGNPQLFTFANSFQPVGSGIVSAFQAPFGFLSPPINFPVTITVQGLLLDDQIVFHVTNAIALEFQ